MRLSSDSLPQAAKPGLEPLSKRERCPEHGLRPRLFDVAVPARLSRFGARVRASALGDPRNPPVIVLGGISANCFPIAAADGSPGWWSGIAGSGCAVDPGRHYVIGVDFAADESGATAPTTFEQAAVLAAALDTIGIVCPAALVGASYGGMVGLALAEAEPKRIDRLVVVAAGAGPHPQSSAARELQRRTVALGLACGQAEEALGIARGMAMLAYRTPCELEQRFAGGIPGPESLSTSDCGAYLRARGEAFGSVMTPQRFLSLSASIDRHRVDPAGIHAPTLVIGATSDQLVFPEELKRLASGLGGPSELRLLDSLYGHDMFLKEAGRVSEAAARFLAEL